MSSFHDEGNLLVEDRSPTVQPILHSVVVLAREGPKSVREVYKDPAV